MFCRGLPFKYTSSLITIILSITACIHIPPRADESGAPLKDYIYQAPLQINDGWKVSSLAEEGVNEEIINNMMEAIFAGKYPNLISIVLIRNGSLILEEFLYYNNRYWLQEFRSAGKRVTYRADGYCFSVPPGLIS
jgi:hypothetical protein